MCSLKKLLETAKIVPAVNQVEMHPHQAQPELLKFCREKGIVLTAYSSTGYSSVATDPVILKIREKFNNTVSPAQISLAWHMSRGTAAVPKSKNAERQEDNLKVRLLKWIIAFPILMKFYFWQRLPKLSKEDLALIDTLHKDVHLCDYPAPTERNGEKLVFGWTYSQMGW